MGYGYDYKCRKCGHHYDVYIGGGFSLPSVYREMVDAISDGVYGDEWRDVYNSTEYAAVNADKHVFICDSCKKWEVGRDLTIYAPNDPEIIRHMTFGDKTVEEWGYVPYVMAGELRVYYHVLKRHYSKCKTCGRRMHKATQEELGNLPCPECGEANSYTETIMWD